MSHLKAFMIGPKAENLDLFRQLILETLDDHAYWRRNFHPEDLPSISRHIQSSQAFRDWEDNLRDLLFGFLAESKRGIPFSSPRYIGHMNTDLLLPGLVGYFAAMLYNQNNVAGESSPVTARLEREVIDMLGQMVGYPPPEDPKEHLPGYLASGGTTANIYSLWVARNLRAWPLAVRLALDRIGNSTDRRIAAIRSSPLGVVSGRKVTAPEGTAWELLNLPISAVQSIRAGLVEEVLSASGGNRRADAKEARREAEKFLDDLVAEHTIKNLGERLFFRRLRETFPNEVRLLDEPWRVAVPANKHYSFPKAADVLGIGQSSLVEVECGGDFTTDLAKLKRFLTESLEEKWPVLALVSIFGATEEGSLDDVAGIADLRDDFEARGLCSWLHVDACYGGYLPAMLRPQQGKPLASSGKIEEWLAALAVEELNLRRDQVMPLIASGEPETPWLRWSEFSRRIAALPRAESISIDPHKLGYVPYPAGAVLLRERAGEQSVSFDVPYLADDHREPAGAFAGRVTLEGSRPGATAAACWLAHRSVPLSQEGHGKVIGASILAARQLYRSLERAAARSTDVKVAFVSRPHFNMLCYVPYHVAVADLAECDAVVDKLAEELSPVEHGDFMVVNTEIRPPSREHVSLTFDEPARERIAASLVRSGREPVLHVLRSVVMGPFSLFAKTRSGTHEESVEIFDSFAEHLMERAGVVFREERAKQWRRTFRPTERVLVVDDDEFVLSGMSELLERIDSELRPLITPARSKVEALNVIRDHDEKPLRFVFLDIDLGAGGGFDAGWELLEDICERNSVVERACRVERVVFLTVGDSRFEDRLRDIRGRFGAAVPLCCKFEKGNIRGEGQEFETSLRDFLLGIQ